jgi:hypothetical protein
MEDRNLFLEALTRQGVLISVSVRYWRARRKLLPEDLGLPRDRVDGDLISLGHKLLVPRESLRHLALIEGRARAAVEESTFPFLNGVAHYLPNTRLAAVSDRLEALKREFETVRDRFLAGYTDLREQALARWREAAAGLGGDPERLVAAVGQAFPPADRIARCFAFEIRLFQIAVPDVPAAELVDLGTRQELIRARREAAAAARTRIETSCREFVSDCVATLRGETAQLCEEMLETMTSGSGVHQKTLNRLKAFIDRFAELNFADDTEMAERLRAVREEFLLRPAAEYREDRPAADRLAAGLAALRRQAVELAREDASGLVANFGRMGRRRFSPAA